MKGWVWFRVPPLQHRVNKSRRFSSWQISDGSETLLVIWHSSDVAAISQAGTGLANSEWAGVFSGHGSARSEGYLYRIPSSFFYLCLPYFKSYSVPLNLFFLHYPPLFPCLPISAPLHLQHLPRTSISSALTHLSQNFQFLTVRPPSRRPFHPLFHCFMCQPLTIIHSF